MDRHVRLFNAGIYQVPIQTGEELATNTAHTAAKFI
jgi:hypothetical protein